MLNWLKRLIGKRPQASTQRDPLADLRSLPALSKTSKRILSRRSGSLMRRTDRLRRGLLRSDRLNPLFPSTAEKQAFTRFKTLKKLHGLRLEFRVGGNDR